MANNPDIIYLSSLVSMATIYKSSETFKLSVFHVLLFKNSVSQQKLKEEREAKRAQLDGRHDYVLSIVASCVGLEKAEVEDAILEGSQVWE